MLNYFSFQFLTMARLHVFTAVAVAVLLLAVFNTANAAAIRKYRLLLLYFQHIFFIFDIL